MRALHPGRTAIRLGCAPPCAAWRSRHRRHPRRRRRGQRRRLCPRPRALLRGAGPRQNPGCQQRPQDPRRPAASPPAAPDPRSTAAGPAPSPWHPRADRPDSSPSRSARWRPNYPPHGGKDACPRPSTVPAGRPEHAGKPPKTATLRKTAADPSPTRRTRSQRRKYRSGNPPTYPAPAPGRGTGRYQ